MRFDASMESLLNVGRSESFADLNNSGGGSSKFQQGGFAWNLIKKVFI